MDYLVKTQIIPSALLCLIHYNMLTVNTNHGYSTEICPELKKYHIVCTNIRLDYNNTYHIHATVHSMIYFASSFCTEYCVTGTDLFSF